MLSYSGYRCQGRKGNNKEMHSSCIATLPLRTGISRTTHMENAKENRRRRKRWQKSAWSATTLKQNAFYLRDCPMLLSCKLERAADRLWVARRSVNRMFAFQAVLWLQVICSHSCQALPLPSCVQRNCGNISFSRWEKGGQRRGKRGGVKKTKILFSLWLEQACLFFRLYRSEIHREQLSETSQRCYMEKKYSVFSTKQNVLKSTF